MIARLFNAPCDPEANTIGTSTIGSSEAIMVSTWSDSNLETVELTRCSWEFWPKRSFGKISARLRVSPMISLT